jgi:hypothetical protein
VTLIRADDLERIRAVDEIENEHADKATLLQAQRAAIAERPEALAVEEQGLTANCSTRYKATKQSGTRPLSAIKWIVMHSTEGGTALGAAAWFQNPDSQGSAHVCLDDRICYRTLEDNRVPWGARGANYGGWHVEQAGYARWTSLIWSSTHRRTLERAAYKAALRCRWYGIPPYFIGAKDLKAGKRGVTTHNECSKAFGGSHWDPGFGWPRLYFMNRLRHHYKLLWHEKRRA